ncbi:VCBS domain-containing protein [Shewanella marisflavi]|nr:VCBS domain-containing protein [Shewanella marisflavi]
METSKGQYGDLVLNPSTGEWHYHLNNYDAKTNALFEGEHHNETFTITATDNLGNRVSSVIRVSVEGSNDLPVISGVHHASLNELGSVDRISGQLIATDPDTGDSIHWAVPHSSGIYGELVINPDTGAWQYRLDNSSPNTLSLHSGQVATETFRVTATDSSGQPVSQIVTIEIHGADQRALIHGMASGSVTEDRNLIAGQLKTSGQLTVIDPDGGDAHFTATSLQGQYGTLTINELGHWTYTADNSQAAIQGLKSGESLTETLYVHSVDGTEQKITVSINGTDDKAVIGGASTGTVTEDKDLYQGQLRVDGALTLTDPDSGQNQFTATSLQGQYGTLTINELGHWTYTADNSQAAIQGLKSGESLTETLYVHSVDGTEQKVTVSINGTDDKAVIGGASTGTVTEDKDLYQGQLRVDGALTLTDPDSGQNQFTATSLQGQYGTLTINELGHWTYTADNSQAAIQGLKSGESLTETLYVHSVDGTEQKVTVSINGTDDKAVIGGASTGTVTEDKDLYQGQLRVDGALTLTDPDSGQNQFTATSLQGQYGTLTINELGHWTYTADNSQAAIQGLKSRESLTETLYVHSVDGTEQKVTVSINGTDDKAVIGGASTGTVTEDKDLYQGQLRVDGALTLTDPDSGQNQFTATSLQGQYGTLTINEFGHWTYTADNSQAAIQGLKAGESLTETLYVHSVDGTEQKVTVSINGSDDKAVISGTATGVVTEDKDLYQGQLRVDGALTLTDPDSGQNQFTATSLQGQYGTLTINELGHWSYTADNSQNAIQGLKSGESLTETLFVHSVDGSEQKVTVTINGTDDKAVIGGAATASVTEDRDLYQGQLRVDGTLTVTDADSGQAQFQATSLQGQFGTLSIDSNGHWTYTADNSQAAIQGLKSRESLTETLYVHSVDGTEQKVTVSINGTDDKAVIGGASTGTVTEDKDLYQGQLRVDGALTVTDADHGEAQFIATSLQGQYGTLTINDLGHWTYTADNSQAAIQGLKTGESLTDTLLVHSIDGTEQKVTVTINGTDDKAVISGTATGAVTEDKGLYQGQLRVDGALTVTDADYGEAQFVATSLQGQYGTLTINDLGHWTYTADNSQAAIQGLKSGESLNENLTVHSLDGTEQQIIIKISGQDDAAVITGEDKGYLKEDHYPAGDAHHTLHYTGSLDVHDPDKGESYFRATHDAQAISDPFGGSLDIEKHGVWQYVVSNDALQHLGKGQFEQVVYRVYSTDGTSKDIKITLEGTNDAPVVSATQILPAGLEDHAFTITQTQLLANVTDVDDNDAGQLTVANLHADHGTITTNPDGSFTFTPEKDYNGEVHFTYDVKDAHGGTAHTGASTTLAAVNDAAIITGTDTGAVTEDLHPHAPVQGNYAYKLEARGTFQAIDPDAGESGFEFKTLISAAMHPEWRPYSSSLGGQLAIDPKGNWNYYIDNRKPEIQHLGKGETLTDTVTVHSKDGTTHDIVITIHGTNDAPTVSSEVHLNSGKEDTVQTITASDLLAHATDIDNNDQGQLTVANLIADHGSIRDNQDGTYTFTPDKDYNGEVHFSYDVKDAHGGVTHTSASTTLTAVSDQAKVSGDTRGELVEDQHLGIQNQIAISGQLNVQDPDAGQAAFQAGTATQVDDPFGGSLHIGADGSWTYDVDNARLQELSEHQEVLVTHRVYTLDGTAQDIVIKITGTNDAPKLGVAQLSSTTGHLTVQDPDSQDSHTFSVAQQTGQFGTLVVDPDTGAYSYRLNQSVAGMHYDKASGQYQGTDTFEVQVSDNHGGSETKFISFDARVSLTAPTDTGQQPQLHATVTSPSQLVDTRPQPTPTQTIGNAITLTLSHGSDTGSSDSDGLTHDTHPVVEGQTDIPFSLVTLYEQGNKLTSVLSDAQGHYSVALSGLSEGAHQISASAQAPGSQQAVQATPLAITLDTQASIDMNPIAGDNMLLAGEQHQPLTISGTVSNVEEGQSVSVTIGGQQYHADVHNGCWSTQLSAAEVDALPGGNLEIKAMVNDMAGNHAQMSSPLYVVDHANPIPSMSFLTPPTPTGTGAIGSHISGDLIAPPLLQQLAPNAPTTGAWAIDDGHGHPTLSLRGQYGTLTIDPDTGHVDYVYNQAPTPGDKAAGGTHWAGETMSETHHDIFHILYHDSHSSNVDVEVNLDITYVHGHSGHNQLSTQLVDMTVTPATPNPAAPPELHDAPQWDGDQDAIDDAQVIIIPTDEDKAEDKHAADQDDKSVHNQPHELAESSAESHGAESNGEVTDARPVMAVALAPVDHYLQMVGLSQQGLAQLDNHTKSHADQETPQMPTEHFDADGLTLTQVDHFDNPLLEEHEKEKPHPSLMDIEDPKDDQHTNAHDDELLHNALNDMHNQF